MLVEYCKLEENFQMFKKSSIIITRGSILKPQTMQIFMHLWVGKTKVYKLLDVIKSVSLLGAGNFAKVTNAHQFAFYSCDAALTNTSLSKASVSQELQLLHNITV